MDHVLKGLIKFIYYVVNIQEDFNTCFLMHEFIHSYTSTCFTVKLTWCSVLIGEKLGIC